MAIKSDQNIINHVVLVLDASSSMSWHRDELIKVADAQIAHLALRSKELDQETRVSVYTFNYTTECVIYDKDVLRLPSIRKHYNPTGMTALVDATNLAVDDLAMTPTKYGDHSFLIFVLTDGQENNSRHQNIVNLPGKLSALPSNWTMACLVPDQMSLHEAKKFGFPAGNIAVWNATDSTGVTEVGETIRQATDSYLTARTTGVRGTRSLFTMATNNLSTTTIKAANLTPLDPSKYVLIPVITDIAIKEFVEQCTTNYQVGRAYYHLNSGHSPKGRRGVKVQGNKQIAVLEKKTNKVFTGSEARKLVGLPDYEVTVDPSKTDGDFDIYVQSTSLNRKLFAGTKLLMML